MTVGGPQVFPLVRRLFAGQRREASRCKYARVAHLNDHLLADIGLHRDKALTCQAGQLCFCLTPIGPLTLNPPAS